MIGNNLDHLRGFTLDERAARLREQQTANQVFQHSTSISFYFLNTFV